jgi:hypothetical protein
VILAPKDGVANVGAFEACRGQVGAGEVRAHRPCGVLEVSADLNRAGEDSSVEDRLPEVCVPEVPRRIADAWELETLTPTLTPTCAIHDGTWRIGVQGETEETAYLRRVHGRHGTRRRIGLLPYKEEVAGSIPASPT